jgi:hypothetical protein
MRLVKYFSYIKIAKSDFERLRSYPPKNIQQTVATTNLQRKEINKAQLERQEVEPEVEMHSDTKEWKEFTSKVNKFLEPFECGPLDFYIEEVDFSSIGSTFEYVAFVDLKLSPHFNVLPLRISWENKDCNEFNNNGGFAAAIIGLDIKASNRQWTVSIVGELAYFNPDSLRDWLDHSLWQDDHDRFSGNGDTLESAFSMLAVKIARVEATLREKAEAVRQIASNLGYENQTSLR